MQRRSIVAELREVEANYEGAMRRAAAQWGKDTTGQPAPDEWWTAVPAPVRAWIIDGYYRSLIAVLEQKAQTWRDKHRTLIERGKSERKYRLLLEQAETADKCRDRIAQWHQDFQHNPAHFRGFIVSACCSEVEP